MKKSTILFILIFISTSSNFAQGFAIGGFGGLTTFQSPDEFANSREDGGYGFDSKLHFGVKAKKEFADKVVSITGKLMFVHFESKEDNIVAKENLYIIGTGMQWDIIPKLEKAHPYLAADLFLCKFSQMKRNAIDVDFMSEGGTRVGVGIGAGVEVPLSPEFFLDFSAMYNINNMGRRETGEDKITTSVLSVGIIYNL